MNWYCQIGGVSAGPYSRQQLERLAAQGVVAPDALVRQGSQGAWKRADALLPELFPGQSRRPPPPIGAGSTPMGHGTDGGQESGIESYRKPILIASGAGVVAILLLLILLLLLLTAKRGPRRVEDHLASAGGGNSGGLGTGTGTGQDTTDRDGDIGGEADASQPAGDPASGKPQSTEEETSADEPAGQEQQDSGGPTGGQTGEPVASGGSDQEGERRRQKPQDDRITIQSVEATGDEEADETEEEDTEGDADSETPPSAESQFLTGGGRGGGGGGGLRPGVDDIFKGRTPAGRQRYSRQEGGSAESEKAVDLALEWLAKHQSVDGGWGLQSYCLTGDCNGRCAGRPVRARPAQQPIPSDGAATAMALLPFLGIGNTHRQGKYRENVDAGFQWLLTLRQSSRAYRQMAGYELALVAYALCEVTAMTGDRELREAAQQAIDSVVEAQHAGGGWRYSRGQAGDLSVTGWNIMALRSAQYAELNVPELTMDRSRTFLDATHDGNGRFGYAGRGGIRPSMTAEGLLCRQYTGMPRDHQDMKSGVNYLLQNLPGQGVSGGGLYYWYYATQTLHHFGGDPWKQWNSALRDHLVALQDREGHAAGSWATYGQQDGSHSGGVLGSTALAICTLEAYYRHRPIYDHRKIK